jgi:transposase
MGKTYEVSKAQAEEIEEIRKSIKDKSTDRRMRAVQLRGEGYSDAEIAVMVEAHVKVVSRWICIFIKKGIEALRAAKREGNRRNMSYEEESEFLAGFEAKAEQGEEVTAKDIKEAYIEKIGHNCGAGQIYRVFKRHEWRKVVPRKEHPQKASEAEIDASKKLTFG